jgi:hypothetical protein
VMVDRSTDADAEAAGVDAAAEAAAAEAAGDEAAGVEEQAARLSATITSSARFISPILPWGVLLLMWCTYRDQA